MFDSFLPPVVCMRAPVLFTFFSLFAYSGVQHILCCVFALLVFVLCTPCCQFLWIVHSFLIAPSVFSNVYFPHRIGERIKKEKKDILILVSREFNVCISYIQSYNYANTGLPLLFR